MKMYVIHRGYEHAPTISTSEDRPKSESSIVDRSNFL